MSEGVGREARGGACVEGRGMKWTSPTSAALDRPTRTTAPQQ